MKKHFQPESGKTLRMKISGHFRISSYGSSGQCKSLFFSNLPFLSSFQFSCFGTKSVTNCNLREQIQIIKGLGDALNVFDNMSRTRPLPSVIQFNQLLSRVVKLKEYSAAILIFKDICNLGIPVSEFTMNIAMNSYCLSNRVDFGFSILGWFFKRGCVPDVFTFSTLLKGLFRENRINEAQELFRKMVNEELCALDVVTYGTVIDGLCKAGNTPMAIEVLRVMGKGRSSCEPNAHIYTMIIDSLCKDRMIDSALKLFDEMSEKEGMIPDVVTYNALVCGLCNLSRWEEAKMLVKKMIGYKIYPDVFTFNSLVDALCKEGLVDEAEDVFHIMKQQNVIPNVITFNSLLDGYCLQGRLDEARNVFESTMSSMNIDPDVRSYNILMNGYCKKMNIDDAMCVFREMPRRGVKPNVATYNTVLQGLFRCGRDSYALMLFDEMQAVGIKPDFYTYCNVLDGLCRNGQVERVVMLLDALEHRKGEIHLHIEYYNIVMDGFCKDKKLDAARAIFRDLAAKGLKPNVVTYTILITGCCESGLLEEAKDLFLRMEHDAGLLPNEFTYNSIIQGNLKWGKYEDASKFLEEMDSKGFSLDPSTFELLLGLLGTTEQNPTILKMIEKGSLVALKQKA